jgi:hypothetical protein
MARRKDLPEFVLEALETASDEELIATADSLGWLAAAVEREPVSAAARQRLLDAVAKNRFLPFVDRLSDFFDLGVERIQEIVQSIDEAASWESGPLPGIDLIHFPGGARVAAADNGIVRMAPGLPFPKHKHLGIERVLILEGGYTDDKGRVWRAGDLHVADQTVEHAFVVLDEGAVYAVSLDGDIWIEGMPGPLRG